VCSVILQRLLVLKLVSSEKRTRPSVRGERNSLAPNIQPVSVCDGKDPTDLHHVLYNLYSSSWTIKRAREESRSTCSCVWLCTRLLPVQFQQEVEPDLGELVGIQFQSDFNSISCVDKVRGQFFFPMRAGLPRWLDMPWTQCMMLRTRLLLNYLPAQVAQLQFVMWINVNAGGFKKKNWCSYGWCDKGRGWSISETWDSRPIEVNVIMLLLRTFFLSPPISHTIW
jgi:hypothetical protein